MLARLVALSARNPVLVACASLALLVWVIYIGTGIKHQGAAYFGHLLWPPGVPTALKPLVGFIEFISTIIVTPFSLTVRLMANMLAGHILLVTFALLTEALLLAETSIFDGFFVKDNRAVISNRAETAFRTQRERYFARYHQVQVHIQR